MAKGKHNWGTAPTRGYPTLATDQKPLPLVKGLAVLYSFPEHPQLLFIDVVTALSIITDVSVAVSACTLC